MKKTIEVHDVKREYLIKKKGGKEKKQALKGITFDIYEGEVFGLLGPNGAGKTTTIKILTTLLSPTSGSVNVLGYDVNTDYEEIRKHINVMFGGEKGLYTRLTAREYLHYFATLYKLPRSTAHVRVEELLNLVNLKENADYELYTFSKGMRQRVHIARALINNPKVIFLDEPTIGLDPIAAEQLREIVKKLAKQKVTVILSTHYMKEADDLCDRVAIINSGQIKAIGSTKLIKDQFKNHHVYEATLKFNDESFFLENMLFKNLKIHIIEGGYKQIRFEVDQAVDFERIKKEIEKNATLLTLDQKEFTLEDAYINIMKVG